MTRPPQTRRRQQRLHRHCLRIDEALKRITEARQNHFDVDPEQPRKWDEVGSAEYVANALEQLAAWIEGTPRVSAPATLR